MRIITHKTSEKDMKIKHLREKIREQILIAEGARLTKYDRKALSFISKLPRGIKLQCPRIETIKTAEDLLDWAISHGEGFIWVDEKGRDYKPFYNRSFRGGKKALIKKGITPEMQDADNDLFIVLSSEVLPDGSEPIMISDIYMPYEAQKAGCALLFYELICEISPDGLVSSRNSVSADAFRIYNIYKNHRGATIRAIPTGDNFKVWSQGRQRKKHAQHWDANKKSFTKKTHPLMYRYKAIGTPVYDALLAAGRLHLV